MTSVIITSSIVLYQLATGIAKGRESSPCRNHATKLLSSVTCSSSVAACLKFEVSFWKARRSACDKKIDEQKKGFWIRYDEPLHVQKPAERSESSESSYFSRTSQSKIQNLKNQEIL